MAVSMADITKLRKMTGAGDISHTYSHNNIFYIELVIFLKTKLRIEN
jgi:hypothetical protein